jgi:hypothetical protein
MAHQINLEIKIENQDNPNPQKEILNFQEPTRGFANKFDAFIH